MNGWLHPVFIEPLAEVAHQKALIGGCLIAVVSGVVGCLIVLRRRAFLTDALSHAMLAGVVASFLFLRLVLGRSGAEGPALLLGAFVAGLVTVAVIAFLSRIARVKEDSAIAMMYTGIFALGAVLASLYRHLIHLDLYHFVTGQVLGVSDGDLWAMAIITALVLSVVILFFRQLQLVSFDRIMAASIGIPVVLLDYVLTTCTSFVVVGAVNMVGVIQVVGLMITPAATAYLLCERLSRMMVMAAVFGVTSVVGGIYLMSWTGNFPPGASIVLVSTGQFLLVLTVAPRYGLVSDWLRRFRLVPEQVLEDVVGCIYRGNDQPVTVETVAKFVEWPIHQVQRALRALQRREWILSVEAGYLLTPQGEKEAKRLVRSHRLWEAYLDHVGVAEDQVHAQAHVLEHMHDQATVDYLDDMLGHPTHDPHGKEIPEDVRQLTPGREVKASLLRQGHRGVVTHVGEAAADSGLRPSMEITSGPRRKDNQIWVFLLADGREVELNHDAADAVSIQLTDIGQAATPQTERT